MVVAGVGIGMAHALLITKKRMQPFVVTLHTVLSTPTARQAEVLTALCQRAALVTVFTETARRMVTDAGVVAADRVCVVPGRVRGLSQHPR